MSIQTLLQITLELFDIEGRDAIQSLVAETRFKVFSIMEEVIVPALFMLLGKRKVLRPQVVEGGCLFFFLVGDVELFSDHI